MKPESIDCFKNHVVDSEQDSDEETCTAELIIAMRDGYEPLEGFLYFDRNVLKYDTFVITITDIIITIIIILIICFVSVK